MEYSYAVDRKYFGEITGKISSISGELIISVTKPFNGEILIRSDTRIRDTYSNTISLIKPQSEHITEVNGSYDRTFYYHTEEESFYISEYEYEKGEFVPRRTSPNWIIDHTKNYQKLQSHFGSLRRLHKGQSCSFLGYAIDRNGRPMHPSTVESAFNKYEWFYNCTAIGN